MPLDRETFASEYDVTEEKVAQARISWEELEKIHRDYLPRVEKLLHFGTVALMDLQEIPEIHSLKMRSKHPLRLLEKIVRKRIAEPERDITSANYLDEITDLVGIRALHLYKRDCADIHQAILSTFTLHEDPILYYRAGDQDLDEYQLPRV